MDENDKPEMGLMGEPIPLPDEQATPIDFKLQPIESETIQRPPHIGTSTRPRDPAKPEANEDMIAYLPNGKGLVLTDGAGGHIGGKAASEAVNAAIITDLSEQDAQNQTADTPDKFERRALWAWRRGLDELDIIHYNEGQPDAETTAVYGEEIITPDGKRYFGLAHSGDSRAYRIQQHDGEIHLQKLTIDQGIVSAHFRDYPAVTEGIIQILDSVTTSTDLNPDSEPGKKFTELIASVPEQDRSEILTYINEFLTKNNQPPVDAITLQFYWNTRNLISSFRRPEIHEPFEITESDIGVLFVCDGVTDNMTTAELTELCSQYIGGPDYDPQGLAELVTHQAGVLAGRRVTADTIRPKFDDITAGVYKFTAPRQNLEALA